MKINLRARNSKVLVIGDAMLDAYWMGNVSRISPEAPVPVLAVNRKTTVAGGAANVALNCSSLGASVELIAVVGADSAAQDLQNCLTQSGIVNLALVADTNRPTTVKTRIVAAGQQIVRIDEEKSEPVECDTEAQLIKHALVALNNKPSVVVISDYGKGV
ncbi:hypothetical protein EBR21_16990, partial [bacterium]|nr:hypothetical protein [bacterium]